MSIVTEEEATKKWCPFARVVEFEKQGSTRARNRVVLTDGDKGELLAERLIGAKCIGSACMAWRVSREPSAEATGYWPADGHSGYCGLAGKP